MSRSRKPRKPRPVGDGCYICDPKRVEKARGVLPFRDRRKVADPIAAIVEGS